MANWIELVTGSLAEKREYRQHKARIDALPEPYGTAAKALYRYFNACGGLVDGPSIVRMLGDFADLWERAAADGTPVRAIVGDDPVEFAESFLQAYSGRHWQDRARERLRDSISAVADAQQPGAQP